MELDMGYVVLALIALPFVTVWACLLAIATGLVRETPEAQTIARNYGLSWQSTHVPD